MSFVVDASMALAWHFEDEAGPGPSAIFARTVDESVLVPSHWFQEIANAALMGERRGRATAAQTASFAKRLGELDIIIDDEGAIDVFERILPLARAHRLTVYDTLYLELAERHGLPLATLDNELAAAAEKIGVERIFS